MKRTSDGRICDLRVRIPKTLIFKIIFNYKNKNQLSWDKFARKIKVSPYTIRHDWIKKRTTIPITILKKMLKASEDLKWNNIKKSAQILEPFWGQKIGKKSKYLNKIVIPNVYDGRFAEFYGILLGDGCIYSNLKGFCISGNSILDKPFIEDYVAKLIEELFNIKPKIYYSSNERSIRCVVYNMNLVRFLSKLGFPIGLKKKHDPRIPNIFFRNNDLISACIRGINDTDGSIYPHPNSKILLDISITSTSLLQSVKKAFRHIGLDVNYTKNRVYLCGNQNILNYLRKVGSSNYKHILKYAHFLKYNKVPSSMETEILLKDEKKSNIKLPYYGPVV